MHRSRAAIARYLAHDVSAASERRTRRHLGACARCRAIYGEETALLRALAGDARRATPAEDTRVV
ncbi:MAG TPA: zf-HC2 domain-containing protein, partial [Polyangia bacterium]